jgi:peroxiredoxin
MHHFAGQYLPLATRSFAMALVVLVAAAENARAADAAPVARRIEAFSLRDTEGGQHTADEFRASKAVVLFFISTECPVANGYAPDIQRIASDYAPRGVACYALHCDPAVTAEIAVEHAKEYGLKLPVWLDPKQTLARATGVRVTPEAVIVGPGGNVLYRGRIDDRYATGGKRRDDPTVHDLETALGQVLAGAEPTVRETKAFGCPLPKVK